MKCFMPVYALALALAVTSDLFEQVSGAACVDATVCSTASTCTTVADGKTNVEQLTRPATTALAACATGKFAYIKSLTIIPDTTTGSVTSATDIKVAYTKDGSTSSLASTAAAVATTPVCDTAYTDIGSGATADVKATIGCASTVTTCKFKYKVEWACQVPPESCAVGSTYCPTCVAASATAATPKSLERPTTGDGVLTCTTGKYAYLKSLTVGAASTTTTDKISVAFTGATGLTSTKIDTTCDGKWADVGKSATLTADVKAVVSCSDTAADCAIKWAGVWACQEADGTNTPTATPTPAPTKSGVSALAGANPVVVWGTALVAAAAGANFAAPL